MVSCSSLHHDSLDIDLGFGVQGVRFRIQSFGFRAYGSGFGVQGLGVRLWALGHVLGFGAEGFRV